jgi:hypothetical protein
VYECNWRRVLDWWSDSLDPLIQRMNTLYNSLLLTNTNVQGHVLIRRCLVAAFNAGHSPSSGFPNCPRAHLPASHSNSSQRRNLTSSLNQSLSNQLFANWSELKWTDFNWTKLNSSQLKWLSPTNCTPYKIWARTAQRTLIHYLSSIVAVETCFLAKPLRGNGCWIAASSAAVA